MAKLTEKQKMFTDEYLIDLNATQAAIRAGYSEKTASEQGARLLANVKVQNYIQKRKNDRKKRTEITQDMIVSELKKLGFAKINIDYLKPADKIKALELMARMLGLDRPVDFGEVEDLTGIEGDVFD